MKLLALLLTGILLLGCAGLEGGEKIKDKDELLEALKDPDIPLHCTFKGEAEEGEVDVEFWRKGEKEAGQGSFTAEGKTLKIKAVSKDGYTYTDPAMLAAITQALVGMFGGEVEENTIEKQFQCKWVKQKVGASQESTSIDEEDLEGYLEQELESTRQHFS